MIPVSWILYRIARNEMPPRDSFWGWCRRFRWYVALADGILCGVVLLPITLHLALLIREVAR